VLKVPYAPIIDPDDAAVTSGGRACPSFCPPGSGDQSSVAGGAMEGGEFLSHTDRNASRGLKAALKCSTLHFHMLGMLTDRL
jgi:hypothetical protein